MPTDLTAWLQLLTRWFHVVVGVYWIGQTALFSWLDTRMKVEVDSEGNQEVWMVHSGGFYRVMKVGEPNTGSRPLHWFKWEAALTWASGVTLLTLVYYFGGILVEPGAEVGVVAARLIGIGVLVVGWFVYDFLWISPLARNERLATVVSLALLVAVAWGLPQVMTGRAAYIHVGALMGTLMAFNVFMRILPAQKQMVAASAAGEPIDPTLGERAKHRSTHNTFMALPVIFLMVSNHFPTLAYGRRDAWQMLCVYLLLGFLARYLINRHQRANG